jgi:competence protein ComEA
MRLQRIVTAGLGLVLALTLFGGTAHAAKAQPVGKVNINSATAQQLESLPGVGPKLAARIVEYRQKAGGFKSAQELMNVKGIGEKNFEKIQAHVSTSGEASKGSAKGGMETAKGAKASPDSVKDESNR